MDIISKIDVNSNCNKVNTGLPLQQCYGCGETDKKLSRCARCLFVRYCSSECQKNDWKNHKPVCIPIKDKLQKEKEIEEQKIEYNEQVNKFEEIYNDKKMSDLEKGLRIYGLAPQCLDKGYIDLANEWVCKDLCNGNLNPMLASLGKDYIKTYAKTLFMRDEKEVNDIKEKVSIIMEIGKKIIDPRKVRELVIDRLCENNCLQNAYLCAKEEENQTQKGFLLGKVAMFISVVDREWARKISEEMPSGKSKKILLRTIKDLNIKQKKFDEKKMKEDQRIKELPEKIQKLIRKDN